MAQAGGRRRRGGRDRGRGLDRQGRRRGPGAGERDDRKDPQAARRDREGRARRWPRSRPPAPRPPSPRRPRAGTARPRPAPAEPGDGDGDGHRASPVARRVAAAEGVDLGKVTGSGPGAAGSRRPTCSPRTAATEPAPLRPRRAEGEAKPLRGPAAMLAKAMNESRSIPTATSFRTLAVDTLDAKRKALNAVLKERGMKVSFTHLVAWAIVKAAEEWRVMGRSFSEEGGKPQSPSSPPTSTSGSRSTSSARAVAEPDGAVHQGRRDPRLRGLPRLLRGPDHQDAREPAHRGRLQGHQHHAHQPGRARDGRLRAAADGRPGHDRRHRLDRLPGRVAARARRQGQGARRLQGDDDDLDLRPPRHPGRRVGVVPAPHRPAARRARTTSTRRSPRRSRSAPASSRPRTRHRPRRRHWQPAAAGAPAAAPRRASRRSPTWSCCRPSRRRPRCSRPTEPTATSPRTSTRSAPSRRATRRSSPRTST